MFLKDPIWFSPVNVIYHFKKLEHSPDFIRDTKAYKKACEAYITAISLVGIIRITGLQAWLQLVDDKDGSPDIRTGCYYKITRDNDFSTQDVEIVTYDSNSKENLIDFLLRTKLSPKKAYDDLTTILCHIHKTVFILTLEELNKELKSKNLRNKSPIMIIGKADPNNEIYKIVQIYPEIDLCLTFDLMEECKKINQPGVLRLNKSAKADLIFNYDKSKKSYPFEKIENIKKYTGYI